MEDIVKKGGNALAFSLSNMLQLAPAGYQLANVLPVSLVSLYHKALGRAQTPRARGSYIHVLLC